MAQRFGGRFSPEAGKTPGDTPPGAPFQGKRRSRAGGRVNVLFFVPIVFAINAFKSDPSDMALNLGAFALLVTAAIFTREGIRAQEAFEARKVARRPAFPRKIFASVLTGAGLFTGGLVFAPTLLNPIIFGVIGTILHFVAFGPDPLKDKGTEGLDKFQTDRVARAVDEAERHLAGMRDAILRAGDRQLEARVDRFAATARQLFRTIEGDPRDLSASRRDIGVFLMGARDATAKFADLYAQSRNAAARADYEQLLTDLETHFRTRTEALLTNDHTDLDIEIAVLRDRLSLETPRPPVESIPPVPSKGD
jgi:hypothetical protein